MAEWSKAVDLGSIPKGRGFKPHLLHFLYRSTVAAESALPREVGLYGCGGNGMGLDGSGGLALFTFY